MEFTVLIHYQRRKGLGPVWEYKTMEVYFDDIEPGTSHREIFDMAKADAHTRLRDPEYPDNYIIDEMEFI